jgi:hypothetical protein
MAVGAAAGPLMENGATCFFHPQHAAQVPCDNCGRFLCALCDLPLGGRHLCPTCIENTSRQSSENPWIAHRFLWGRAALLIALIPALAYPFTFLTFLTAPVTLVLALLWWNKPAGLTGNGGRLSLVLAVLFAGLQILAWIGAVFVFVGLIKNRANFLPAVQEVFFL